VITVADLVRAVRRADQLLEAAGFEIFFIADENGPDVDTVFRSTLGGAATDPVLWRQYARAIESEHRGKVVVFFRAGADGGCSPSTPLDVMALPPVDDAGCATPWDDRLAHALVYSLGLRRIPDRPLSWWSAAWVTAQLRERMLE